MLGQPSPQKGDASDKDKAIEQDDDRPEEDRFAFCLRAAIFGVIIPAHAARPFGFTGSP